MFAPLAADNSARTCSFDGVFIGCADNESACPTNAAILGAMIRRAGIGPVSNVESVHLERHEQETAEHNPDEGDTHNRPPQANSGVYRGFPIPARGRGLAREAPRKRGNSSRISVATDIATPSAIRSHGCGRAVSRRPEVFGRTCRPIQGPPPRSLPGPIHNRAHVRRGERGRYVRTVERRDSGRSLQGTDTIRIGPSVERIYRWEDEVLNVQVLETHGRSLQVRGAPRRSWHE